MAGLIAWKGNRTAPFPLKVAYSVGGVFLSTLVTHGKSRNFLKHKIESILPEKITENYKMINEKVGFFGSDVWNRSEDCYNQIEGGICKFLLFFKK